MKKYILIAACLIFVGCAPTKFYHPYKTERDFKPEWHDCSSTARSKVVAGTANLFWQNDAIYCMNMKYGWNVYK